MNSFLYNTPFLHSVQNVFLPITNDDELNTFITHVSDTKFDNKGKLQNLINGLTIIKNNDTSKIPTYFKGPSSLYYFKVYASLMSSDYFEDMIQDNAVFDSLYKNAKGSNEQTFKSYSAATSSWKTDANQLKSHFDKMRKHNNKELIEIADDNTTLLRQANINQDFYLRRKYLNKRLNSTVYFICFLILIGYLKSINYDKGIVGIMTLTITTIYIINIVLSYRYQNNMHKLNFNKLNHPGYPVRNEETQNKYLGNCSNDNYNETFSSNKCNFSK